MLLGEFKNVSGDIYWLSDILVVSSHHMKHILENQLLSKDDPGDETGSCTVVFLKLLCIASASQRLTYIFQSPAAGWDAA